jgi:hypothetical protein
MLGHQLREAGIEAEITCIEGSPSARRLCEARAAMRGLEMRVVDRGDPDEGAPERFDYIDGGAVLQRTHDPVAALRRLAVRLAPGGGIGIAAHGAYGCRGLAELDALLAALAPSDLPMPQRLQAARRLLRDLPPTHRYRLGPLATGGLDTDELLSMLLQGRHRAWRIEALLATVAEAGLRLAGLLERARYEPASYIADPVLRARFAALDPVARLAAGEAIAGSLWRHLLYVSSAVEPEPAPPDPGDLDLVPLCRHEPSGISAKSLGADRVLRLTIDGVTHALALPPLATAILPRIDGRRSGRAIFEELRGGPQPALAEAEFRDAYIAVIGPLIGFNRLLLRRP